MSRIELLTKTDADEYAYLYRISGGEEQGIEPAARPVGTTITVRDLFYNTPARDVYKRQVYLRFICAKMLFEPDCTGKCKWRLMCALFPAITASGL